MSSVVGTMPIWVPLKDIQEEVRQLTQKYPISDFFNQLSLTYREGAESPFYDGLGSLYDHEQKMLVHKERDFDQIHPDLEGTQLEALVENVRKWSPFPLGRIRLMRLPPKSCLSYHKDENLRFHLPLKTNREALFFFEDHRPFHLPANGQMFWMNTRKLHTAMNGSNTEERIHIVFSTVAEAKEDYQTFVDKQSAQGDLHV